MDEVRNAVRRMSSDKTDGLTTDLTRDADLELKDPLYKDIK